MSNAIYTALIGGAAGLMTGVIGSLFAPWVQYAVQTSHKRNEARRDLIAYTRGEINRPDFNVDQFRIDQKYFQFEPHLANELRTVMGKERPAQQIPLTRADLLAEIARIERKWRLV